MLRILKTVLALTTILALAACSSVTGPDTDEQQSVATDKQEILFPDDGTGNAGQPSTGTPEEEDDAGSNNGRGQRRN